MSPKPIVNYLQGEKLERAQSHQDVYAKLNYFV